MKIRLDFLSVWRVCERVREREEFERAASVGGAPDAPPPSKNFGGK